HLGDIAYLPREVASHRVDGIGEVFPRASDTAHHRLAAELAVGPDFARHARHFRGEGIELIDHSVEGFLQLQDFASHIDGDLPRKVAAGDGGCDLGDVAHLPREVSGHRVDGIGEVFPCAGDARYQCLAAELAVGADLARHA